MWDVYNFIARSAKNLFITKGQVMYISVYGQVTINAHSRKYSNLMCLVSMILNNKMF